MSTASGLNDAIALVAGEDDVGLEPELETPDPEMPAGAPGSVLAAVRARARELEQETTVDIPLPGYGNLVGRYRAISIARVFNGPGGRLRNPLTEWGTAADALALGLIGLYGLRDGQPVPLYDSGDPARYDMELADAMGLHPVKRTARAVLVALLGGADEERGKSRIWSHYLAYQNWLTDGTAPEVAEEAAGES